MEIELTKKQVERYSAEYLKDGDRGDGLVEERLLAAAERGHLTGSDLEVAARWKYPGRALRLLLSENYGREIRDISNASFGARTERLRIGALLALRGIGWPMAGVVLHFAFRCSHPILDVRAMRTIRADANYNFDKWTAYTGLSGETAREYGVALRVLDRALWMCDKRNEDRRKRTAGKR